MEIFISGIIISLVWHLIIFPFLRRKYWEWKLIRGTKALLKEYTGKDWEVNIKVFDVYQTRSKEQISD